MARVDDRWVLKDGARTPMYGKGSRWQAVWTEAGRERKKAFRTKDAAKAHLTHVDHTQRSGTYVSRDLGRVYIGELLDPWLDSCVHLAPSTMATTRSDVRATIRPYWGDKVLADVTKADVQAWVTSMAKAARTVDTIYGRFRNFLNWCISEGRLQVNPATGVKLPKGRKREHIYLTVDQVRALAAAIGDHGDLVWFLATTGLRFGEAAELRGRDIDLRRRRVIVSRSVTEADGRMVVGPPKNGEPRDVPLTAFMVERIRDRAKGLGRDALVFPTQRGKWMRSNNFKTRTYDPAVIAAGLPPELWVHDLRHTAASLAVHSGASVKSVQRMLGHASAALTLDIYAGLFDQELSDVAARMDHLLAPKLVPALPNSSQTA